MLRKLKISSFYATTRIISFCFKFFTSFNPVSQVHTESRIEQILRLVRVPRVLTRSMSYRKSGLGDIVHNIINLSIKLHETTKRITFIATFVDRFLFETLTFPSILIDYFHDATVFDWKSRNRDRGKESRQKKIKEKKKKKRG